MRDPRRKNRFTAHVGRLDGSKEPGRQPTVAVGLRFDAALAEWYHDRAAILGVPYTVLIRDVLAYWKELVAAGEAEQGISYDDLEATPYDYATVFVPERVPGYHKALEPYGNKPTHLDDSPLTPEEVL